MSPLDDTPPEPERHAGRPCPCDTGLTYRDCCGPLHRGARPADTPVQLMRSRYSAFALGGLGDYLLKTWEPGTRPALTADALDDVDNRWEGLEIVSSTSQGNRGTGEFKAYYREWGNAESARRVLHERSRFRCRDGLWRYVDGIIDPPAPGASRNAPCPCGSGRKAKRCCHS